MDSRFTFDNDSPVSFFKIKIGFLIDMFEPNEKVIARRLLKLKSEGLTWGSLLRRNALNYILLYVLALSAVFLWAKAFSVSAAAFYGIFLFAFGFCTGAMMRDFRWFIAIKRCWPFTLKTTHWDRVENLAKADAAVEKIAEKM